MPLSIEGSIDFSDFWVLLLSGGEGGAVEARKLPSPCRISKKNFLTKNRIRLKGFVEGVGNERFIANLQLFAKILHRCKFRGCHDDPGPRQVFAILESSRDRSKKNRLIEVRRGFLLFSRTLQRHIQKLISRF